MQLTRAAFTATSAARGALARELVVGDRASGTMPAPTGSVSSGCSPQAVQFCIVVTASTKSGTNSTFVKVLGQMMGAPLNPGKPRIQCSANAGPSRRVSPAPLEEGGPRAAKEETFLPVATNRQKKYYSLVIVSRRAGSRVIDLSHREAKFLRYAILMSAALCSVAIGSWLRASPLLLLIPCLTCACISIMAMRAFPTAQIRIDEPFTITADPLYVIVRQVCLWIAGLALLLHVGGLDGFQELSGAIGVLLLLQSVSFPFLQIANAVLIRQTRKGHVR